MKKIKGLIAAPLAPFDEKGELNLSLVDDYVSHLENENIKGVFVNGTSGEGILLTTDERKKLAEKWIQASKERMGNPGSVIVPHYDSCKTTEELNILSRTFVSALRIEKLPAQLDPVIIHIGCPNLKDSQELAKHAESAGATAIGLMPTTYYIPKTVDDLVEYVLQVANCAPNTPLFYYHIPVWSHVTFLMEDFLKAAILRIPTLAGVKFTSTDMFDLGRCLFLFALDEKIQILFGGDEILISALAMGACASVGGTYSFAGRLHNRIFDAFNRGDIETARKEQYRSQSMVKIYMKYGGHAGVGKAIMRFLGLDLGPSRPPLSQLSAMQEAALREELEEIGFFAWK